MLSISRSGKDNIDVFVPGRLCVLGEHTDWAAQRQGHLPHETRVPGQAIIFCTEQGIYANARLLQTSGLRTTSTTLAGQKEHFECPLHPPDLLREARGGGFWAYVAGTAYWLALEHKLGGHGIEIDNYRSTLPMGKGLSSSAATCVLVATVFNELLDLRLTKRGIMEVAYRGETLTGSACGHLDQACALGCRSLHLTFEGDVIRDEPLVLAAPLHFVIVDLGAAKDTVKILNSLQAAFEQEACGRDGAAEHPLRELLGTFNADVCERAVACMRSGDTTALGALMRRAQAEFDRVAAPACLEELQAPVLHAVLGHPDIEEHVLGGKGVGSQGDGAAQLLCKDAGAAAAVRQRLEAQLGLECIVMTVPADEGA